MKCTNNFSNFVSMTEIPNITIALDGYSSTGKSSFAKLIADRLGFLYLDSGALYRGVTLYAIENGLITSDSVIDGDKLAIALDTLDLHFDDRTKPAHLYMGERDIEKEIRTMKVSSFVSPIATISFVREYVNKILRLEGRDGRVVMDGRDIGTTVFPNAELKIFMTADPMVRAGRRAAEMEAKGEKVDINDVLENLKQRDYIDSHREVSPLRKASDAIVLDNSNMTFEQQMDWVLSIIENKWPSR